ncbi:MAG: O-antigen ligase family protein [Acidobacteriia bacterium]|nr:O-antigen ligase family protein [Terriglobia bacterium]
MVIEDNGNLVPAEVSERRTSFRVADPTKMAFFWLTAFFVVYCARPEDWIPGLKYVPLAKITAIFAIWGLFSAQGKTKRTFKDLPKEASILLIMIGLLYVGAFLSPIWIGGAVSHTIDFSKIYIAWVLVFLLITTFDRLRRIIFIQTFSVVVVCAVAIVKGHSLPRLEGALGGIYSNPNDLAFAIVLTLPFALAFMVTSKNPVVKVFWLCGMLVMMVAIFMTASRAGFIDLIISGSVTLYFFAIKGRRFYLLVATFLVGVVVMGAFGGKLIDRFEAMGGGSTDVKSAYGSYEDRKYLMVRAVDAIEHYPIFGLGAHNFYTYSLIWHDVHMTYLQIGADGGIAVLVLYLMFFYRGFKNLKILRHTKNLDPDIVLYIGALQSSLVGFVVGACFAPEGYQYFPYFAVAFTATLLRTIQEQQQEQGTGTAPPPPKRPHHFLEVYADRKSTRAVSPVR